ncbi:MAG: beta-galactosidase trimerization domain-containing protein, partial [Clostridia bacterium]
DSKRFPELVHPNLCRRNLLIEQVRALHAVGIKAPVYITVQWDYHSATTHPEWLIRKRDGAHEGDAFTEPGFYQSLCVNTGYADFLKAQTLEVIELLGNELDGLFFDIVGIRPCLCAACRAEMKANGVDAADDTAVHAFAKFVMDRFKRDMTALVREHNSQCTIFYNAGHVGPCTRESKEAYSHFELESLPSGGWGYLHFPVTARYARKLGLDCMGMTGKFHTSWGDFHSLKNRAALEFEAFRMLAFGFACSIGDQLEPCGRLNPATYRLIGQVYARFASCEPWARPAKALTEVALLTSENPMVEHQMPESILGAAQLLDELAVQFDILDDSMPIDDYRLVLLPDDFIATEAFQEKLNAYVAAGGRVIACHRGGLNKDGAYPTCFGAEYRGETLAYPDFLLAEGALATNLEPENEYAMYRQGAQIAPCGGNVLLTARAPFFKRAGDRFCSHRYTPSAHGQPYPAALRTGDVICFAHPLFGQYRENAPHWVKQLMQNAIDLLLPER